MIGDADVLFWLGQCPDKYSVLFYDGCNILVGYIIGDFSSINVSCHACPGVIKVTGC